MRYIRFTLLTSLYVAISHIKVLKTACNRGDFYFNLHDEEMFNENDPSVRCYSTRHVYQRVAFSKTISPVRTLHAFSELPMLKITSSVAFSLQATSKVR